jgi:hypothetical protein
VASVPDLMLLRVGEISSRRGSARERWRDIFLPWPDVLEPLGVRVVVTSGTALCGGVPNGESFSKGLCPI